VKVRIGIGTSGHVADPHALEAICADLIELRFDSIWVSEVLSQPGLDPLVSLAWLAAQLEKLKIGTTFLVPGRNLLRLARQLATLDFLSGGRLLVTAVPGLGVGGEATAVGVEQSARSAALDDALPILTSLLAGLPTDVPSPAGVTNGVVLDPLPKQQPLEIWLGGSARSALVRCGRFGEGWLPSMITPTDAAAGRQVIEEVAEEAGRRIDPEHFGVSIGYAHVPLEGPVLEQLRRSAKRDDVSEMVPVGMEQLRELIERYLDVGFSKFVLRPLATPIDWRSELEVLAGHVGDLQT
jgi:probable F420-dependent oxidoreductase